MDTVRHRGDWIFAPVDQVRPYREVDPESLGTWTAGPCATTPPRTCRSVTNHEGLHALAEFDGEDALAQVIRILESGPACWAPGGYWHLLDQLAEADGTVSMRAHARATNAPLARLLLLAAVTAVDHRRSSLSSSLCSSGPSRTPARRPT